MRPRVLLAALLLIVTLQLAACGRLSPAAPIDNTGSGVDLSDPDVGGGAGEDTGPQTPIPTATPTSENSPRLDATAEAIATFPPTLTATPTTDSRQPTAALTIAVPTAEPAIPPPTAEPPTAAPTAAPEPSPTAAGEMESSSGTIHVVQPGENLYRIGLQYGLSWVVIAQYNGIVDPNAIVVGQELRIPPLPTATPEAQSSAPTTTLSSLTFAQGSGGGVGPTGVGEQGSENNQQLPANDPLPLAAVSGRPSAVVTVSPGDTLYSLAQQHGVSWDQIAEANGLAAANQIYAGQVLKIPADAPGPTQAFTHQVHRGETLTGIARQYGFSPAALAEANALAAPYVIYPGQQLVIPSDE